MPPWHLVPQPPHWHCKCHGCPYLCNAPLSQHPFSCRARTGWVPLRRNTTLGARGSRGHAVQSTAVGPGKGHPAAALYAAFGFVGARIRWAHQTWLGTGLSLWAPPPCFPVGPATLSSRWAPPFSDACRTPVGCRRRPAPLQARAVASSGLPPSLLATGPCRRSRAFLAFPADADLLCHTHKLCDTTRNAPQPGCELSLAVAAPY